MLQEARLHRIRTLVATFGQLTTERIVHDLGVSRETVRRDILTLEGEGLLRRVHGGVIAASAEPEPPLAVRQTVREKEKRAIARAAARLLQPGQTVFIDAGSTTTLLAEELATLAGLTVLTNSVPIASRLAAADRGGERHQVLLLGGRMVADVQATYGETTVAEVHRYRADVAISSPVALSAQHGASSFAHHEAELARAMMRMAQKRVILADHSKIGQVSRVSYVSAEEIDVVVTDAAARQASGLAALQAVIGELVVG